MWGACEVLEIFVLGIFMTLTLVSIPGGLFCWFIYDGAMLETTKIKHANATICTA